MTVSTSDQSKMRTLAITLAESETDDRGTPEQRRALLELINLDRAGVGATALDDRAPEEGLYDRAKSLGMARIDR
jgi:hypothetical protein